MPSNGEQAVVNGCFMFIFNQESPAKHENLLLMGRVMWAWSIEHFSLGFVLFEHQSLFSPSCPRLAVLESKLEKCR